jgi:hypothetical protein
VPEGEDRPRLAIEAARRWADDQSEENRQRVRDAAAAAYNAAAAAYNAADAATPAAASAAYATAAAAYATYADATYADAATASTYADAAYAAVAYASYADAVDDAADEASAEVLRRCADLVREHIPLAAVLAAAVTRLGGRP